MGTNREKLTSSSGREAVQRNSSIQEEDDGTFENPFVGDRDFGVDNDVCSLDSSSTQNSHEVCSQVFLN